MAVRLGQLSLQKSNTEKECYQCKEVILKKKWYAKTYSHFGKKYFSVHYHLECFPQYILEKVKDRQQNPRSNKHKTNRLQTLSEDQIARRQTLQVYLRGKDLDRLLRAYKSEDVVRVKNAYRMIASRWAELNEMGIVFRQTIIPRQRKYWTDKQQELEKLIQLYDFIWLGRFQNATDLQARMSLLMREDDTLSFDT